MECPECKNTDEILFFVHNRITWGRIVHYFVFCAGCNRKIHVEVDLDEVSEV